MSQTPKQAIEQIIGWAKVGRSRDYYEMKAENVDTMADDILRAIAPPPPPSYDPDRDGPLDGPTQETP